MERDGWEDSCVYTEEEMAKGMGGQIKRERSMWNKGG